MNSPLRSLSPPPVPSTEVPESDKGWRFGTLEPHARTEWPELYRPGGYHPVHLGDLMGDNQKYKVIYKKSYGSFSTV